MEDLTPSATNLSTPYTAKAVFYEASDIVEYVRADVATVSRRVDSFLTLAYDMKHTDQLVAELGGERHVLVGELQREARRIVVDVALDEGQHAPADRAEADQAEAQDEQRHQALAHHAQRRDRNHDRGAGQREGDGAFVGVVRRAGQRGRASGTGGAAGSGQWPRHVRSRYGPFG